MSIATLLKGNYSLNFYSKVVNNKKYNFCESSNPIYVNLSFFSNLSKFDCQSFIFDLERSINGGGNVDDYFLSDSVEDRVIAYNYPNIVIDDILTISMADLKELLQEWLVFIS